MNDIQYKIDYARKYGIRRLEMNEIIKVEDIGYAQPGAKKFIPTSGIKYDPNNMHPIYRKIAKKDVKLFYLKSEEFKLKEEQKELMKKIRKKYKEFRGLYFKKKYLGKNMRMPRIKEITLKFNNNLRTVWGRCWSYRVHGYNTLEFNYQELSKCSEKELDNTIIHEMIHLIAKDTHGRHFQYLMDYVNRMAGEKIVSRYTNN